MPVSLSREFTLAAFWHKVKVDPAGAQLEFWTVLNRYQRLCLNHTMLLRSHTELRKTLDEAIITAEHLAAQVEELKTANAMLTTRCMQQQFVIDELEGVRHG